MVRVNDVRLGSCCGAGNLMLYAGKLIVHYAGILAGDFFASVISLCRYPGWLLVDGLISLCRHPGWLVAMRRATRVKGSIGCNVLLGHSVYVIV